MKFLTLIRILDLTIIKSQMTMKIHTTIKTQTKIKTQMTKKILLNPKMKETFMSCLNLKVTLLTVQLRSLREYLSLWSALS